VEDSLCYLLARLLLVLLLLSLCLGRVGLLSLGRFGESAHGYGMGMVYAIKY
jgi:hypothetical protein